MKWGRRFFLIGISLFAAVAAGCEPSHPPTAVTEVGKNEYIFNMGVIITRGSRSFIPLNISGEPAGNVEKIFGVLAKFESENPNREIVFWQIEKKQRAEGSRAYIDGIWVEHKEKKK
ncbi:MAG: hypothetical protein UX72_C0013G0029 [Parcubacteria group bacterium GW2011_GWA2_47_10]|nr:MAG: hypothetical protein UX72_C0013G0029 [Parcubacteria group bacterium GW2011_GWA2_47_10]